MGADHAAHAARRNAKASESLRKLSDGGGLQLWVQPSGGKLWRLAYRYGRKQKLLAIGRYPLVSLGDARQARDEAKRALLAGQDPSEVKRASKAAAKAGPTFKELAEEYLAKLTREQKSERTLDKVAWLLGLAYPELGKRPLDAIKAADIFPVLQAVELSGRRESARRLRSTIGAVFRYAISTGRGEADPTMALKGALAAPIITPRAAITEPKKLGALLRATDGFDGQPTTHAALRLMAILFPRPGELRAAEWSEFDHDKAEWTIPASRAKMRRPHRVPLPAQAIAILEDLRRFDGDPGQYDLSYAFRLTGEYSGEGRQKRREQYLAWNAMPGSDQVNHHLGLVGGDDFDPSKGACWHTRTSGLCMRLASRRDVRILAPGLKPLDYQR